MALNTGLQLAFDMAETAAGPIVDSIQGVSAAALGTGTIPYRDNYLGSRLLSQSNQQRFSAPDSMAFDFLSAGSWSGELWVQLSDIAAGKDLVSKFLSTGNQRSFIVTYSFGSGRITFIVSSDGSAISGTVAATTTTITVGERYHVLFWCDAENGLIGIRVNNGDVITTPYSAGVFNSTAAFVVAGRDGSTSTASGLFSKLRMWNRVPTPEEQTTLYNKGCPIPAAALENFIGMKRIAVFGQSNASGRGTNNRAWSHPDQYFAQYFGSTSGPAWKLATDPFDANALALDPVADDSTTPGGHWIHSFATSHMADTGESIAALVVAKGGTSITGFLPGADHFDRTTLYGSLVYHANSIGGIDEVFWWQGETDMSAGMSESVYNAHLDTIANALMADMPAGYQGMRVCRLQHLSLVPEPNQAAINAAIRQAWFDNPNVLRGPDFSGIEADADGLHFTTDEKVDAAGQSWYQSQFQVFRPAFATAGVNQGVL